MNCNRVVLLLLTIAHTLGNYACEQLGFDPLPLARVPEGFCVSEYATGFLKPRGVDVLSNGDLLVIDMSGSKLWLLWDGDGNGVSDNNERALLVDGDEGINHAVLYHQGYIYASTPVQVYRWPYTLGSREPLQDVHLVVDNIKGSASSELGGEGGHRTRTLVVDSENRLYVQCGSRYNVDPDSSRSMIRRFSLEDLDQNQEITYSWDDGEVFADGLRNEVALDFDGQGVLWGAENGADNLYRDELGGVLSFNNPAEELNRFPEGNADNLHYGYPYCWTEYDLGEPGLGRGTQWAWPPTSTFSDTKTDEWCRANAEPPVMAMQAHSAPLGMRFNLPNHSAPYRFPPGYDDDLFIAFHGSWNRNIPTGYKVVTVPMGEDGMPTSPQPIDFLRADSEQDNGWPYRPLDLAFAPSGEFYLTSGSGCTWRTQGENTIATCTGGNIMAVRYYNPPTASPTASPSEAITVPPTESPSADCTNDPIFTTEYGGNCLSYLPTNVNHGYCQKDGAVEKCSLSCKQECLLAVICTDSDTFDQGWGGCRSYVKGTINHDYCDIDDAVRHCPVSCGLCTVCDESKGRCRERDCGSNKPVASGGCHCDQACVSYDDCCCNYKEACG